MDSCLLLEQLSTDKVVSCFEKAFGVAKMQKIPCDASIQNEDNSPSLTLADSSAYRSVIGLLLYLARDRLDIMFSVKELSSCMSAPTMGALQKLRKLVGYLKASGEIGIKLTIPEHGKGHCKTGGECFWLVETFTGADWSGSRKHRKSTSSAIHFINNNLAYSPSRTQRVVSFSSAESELHSMVSGCSDAIFIRRCLEFLVGEEAQQYQWTDNSAARQLVSRQGVGKIRHLSGKILWIQSQVLEQKLVVCQVPTAMNCSDIGTKALAKKRLLMLLNQVGAIDPSTMEPIGQEEYDEVANQLVGQQSMQRLVKSVMRMAAMMGLEPMLTPPGVDAMSTSETCNVDSQDNSTGETFWLWIFLGFMLLLWMVFAVTAWFTLKGLGRDLTQCWNQVAEEDEYAGQLNGRLGGVQERLASFDTQMDMLRDELRDEIETVSNNESMLRDYVNGLHFSFVESGGYLRHGLGLTGAQWVHMTTLERANMITEQTMGTQQYMRALRQRAIPQGPVDSTDNEESESDAAAEDMEVEPGTMAGIPQTVTDMTEFLKSEHLACPLDQEKRECFCILKIENDSLQGKCAKLSRDTMLYKAEYDEVEIVQDEDLMYQLQNQMDEDSTLSAQRCGSIEFSEYEGSAGVVCEVLRGVVHFYRGRTYCQCGSGLNWCCVGRSMWTGKHNSQELSYLLDEINVTRRTMIVSECKYLSFCDGIWLRTLAGFRHDAPSGSTTSTEIRFAVAVGWNQCSRRTYRSWSSA
eukprot:s367_g23.t1